MSARTYLTAAEALALLAIHMTSTDTRRITFAAMSGADQLVCLVLASANFDAVAWRGRVVDMSQPMMWPRRANPGESQATFDADCGPLPSGIAAWSVAGLPYGFREGVAFQATLHAMRSAGLDYTGHASDLAARGVTSANGEGIDGVIARDPWARLCADAQTWMASYRACAMGGI